MKLLFELSVCKAGKEVNIQKTHQIFFCHPSGSAQIHMEQPVGTEGSFLQSKKCFDAATRLNYTFLISIYIMLVIKVQCFVPSAGLQDGADGQ